MSLILEKEIVDYILSQEYDWKPNVAIPETFKVVMFVGPILYLSVPTPIVPFISLLTNSYQLLECAKYPFPRA